MQGDALRPRPGASDPGAPGAPGSEMLLARRSVRRSVWRFDAGISAGGGQLAHDLRVCAAFATPSARYPRVGRACALAVSHSERPVTRTLFCAAAARFATPVRWLECTRTEGTRVLSTITLTMSDAACFRRRLMKAMHILPYPFVLVLLALGTCGVAAQPTLSTIAGGTRVAGELNGPVANATFNFPYGVALRKSDGSIFVSENRNHAIRLISPTGIVTTVAGSPIGASGFVDGVGSDARFKNPSGIALDSAENLIVADSDNHAIRMVSPNGTVTTLAGGQTISVVNGITTIFPSRGSVDGTGTAAGFYFPTDVTTLSDGSIVVVDSNNYAIRRIAPGATAGAGVVTTIAGSLTNPGFVDGQGTSALFNFPIGIASDTAGNIYVSDINNNNIRFISTSGAVSTFAGIVPTDLSAPSGFADGVGTAATFNYPYGIAVDPSGNVFVADGGNNAIRVIAPAGTVTTAVGNGSPGHLDGVGVQATLKWPFGIAFNAAGGLLVADAGNNDIRLMSGSPCDSSKQATSPLTCVPRPGFFSSPGVSVATPCPSGFTSAGKISSVDVTSCSVKCDVATPAGCSDIYTFDETATPVTTGCYYGNAASGLSSGIWTTATSGADSP